MRKKLRIGRFDIPRETILNEPELAIAITKNMLIFRAEMMLHKDAIEYIAISDQFEEIENGEISPYYDFIITKINDEIRIKTKRRNV